MSDFTDALVRAVLASIPRTPPVVVTATVNSVVPATDDTLARVSVDYGGATDITADYSSAFDMAITALGNNIIGQTVLLVPNVAPPCIADIVIKGRHE